MKNTNDGEQPGGILVPGSGASRRKRIPVHCIMETVSPRRRPGGLPE
jgi:hypothetical protein